MIPEKQKILTICKTIKKNLIFVIFSVNIYLFLCKILHLNSLLKGAGAGFLYVFGHIFCNILAQAHS